MKKLLFVLAFAITLLSCNVEEPIPTYTVFTHVTANVGGKITISPQLTNYKKGELVTFTAIPDDFWVFKQWEGDVNSNTNPLQVIIDSNKSIVGTFVKKEYLLNIIIDGEGTVEEKIVTNPNGREYPHGTTVELTPKPKEGWVFDSWSGDLTGTESPKNITVDQEKNVIAKFIKKPIFKLANNGITCICENVKPGDIGYINNIKYEAVDNKLLRTRRDENADMTKLCTSLVTDMSNLFAGTDENINTFNQPIGNWDVSNVTNMGAMFSHSTFNYPIGNWNVSNVTNMFGMFLDAAAFNQPIGNWNVSKITNSSFMFSGARVFNQPIGNWDVSNVTNMDAMFQLASKFNQPIGNWNVSKVTSIGWIFAFAGEFAQDISSWDVSKVKNMDRVFAYALKFNSNISRWNVRSAEHMNLMFFEANTFNQDISKWCVPNIKSEPSSFSNNSPLSNSNKPVWGTCPN